MNKNMIEVNNILNSVVESMEKDPSTVTLNSIFSSLQKCCKLDSTCLEGNPLAYILILQASHRLNFSQTIPKKECAMAMRYSELFSFFNANN